MADLRVELLYTPECPHYDAVRSDLHRILSEGAIETPIQLVLVDDVDDAEFLHFPGSPTVRMNGVDVVPPPEAPPSLSCRMYRQPDGSLAGRIPEAVLRAAVQAHRQGRLEAFRRDEAANVAAAARSAADEDAATQPGRTPDEPGPPGPSAPAPDDAEGPGGGTS